MTRPLRPAPAAPRCFCVTGATPRKQPGADRPITIAPSGKRIRVSFAGKVIADSTNALVLMETGYPPVFYIPRADAALDLLQRIDHRSHCPHKGDASYFSIKADGNSAENAVWSYEQPFPAVAAIKDHLAFYRNRVDSIEEV